MLDSLRDPLWQALGALVAVVFGIAGIIVAILLARKRKRLEYRVLANIPLLRSPDAVGDQIKVFLGSEQLSHPVVLQVELAYSGAEPIRPTDYERPISFGCGSVVRLLSADPVFAEPPQLHPKVTLVDNRAVLEKVLLNGRDRLYLRLLVDGQDPKVDADCRIAGLARITETSTADLQRTMLFRVCLSALCIFAVLVTLTQSRDMLTRNIVELVGCGAIGLILWNFLRSLRRRL